MITHFNKIFTLTVLCFLVTLQTSYANDIQRQQVMSRQQSINLQPIANSAEETYTPVAFAADLDNYVDKHVYQNKAGEIVISKSYVPDNY